MAEWLPALSIPQPWNHFVTHGLQEVYSVNFWPTWRGRRFMRGDQWRMFLHAPQNVDLFNSFTGRFVYPTDSFTCKLNGTPIANLIPAYYPRPVETFIGRGGSPVDVPTGAITGLATLVAVIPVEQATSPWQDRSKKFGLVFEKPKILAPYKCKGNVGIFEINADEVWAHYKRRETEERLTWSQVFIDWQEMLRDTVMILVSFRPEDHMHEYWNKECNGSKVLDALRATCQQIGYEWHWQSRYHGEKDQHLLLFSMQEPWGQHEEALLNQLVEQQTIASWKVLYLPEVFKKGTQRDG